jgi:hypothetical protein
MRPIKFQFLLWCNALVFAFYLAGLLFDLFILVPNWRSGTVNEIQVFNAFFHYTDPVDFYKAIMPVSTGLSVICFVVFANRGNPMLMFLAISLLIDIGIDAVTLHYFIPINQYLSLEQGSELNPQRVSDYVRSWITADYLRIGLIMIGVYAAVAAVHYSYRKQ